MSVQDSFLRRRRDSLDDSQPDKITVRLNSGKVFHYSDPPIHNDKLLTPTWVEWNLCVRHVISRIPKSISKRLRYLSNYIGEEMIHGEDGERLVDHLQDQVFAAYYRESRLRRAMCNILTRWRCYHLDRRASTDEIDPITLEVPIKPIVIYSWIMRKRFTFDAASLAIHIETQLLHQMDGFPCPLSPRNPWNNVPFTYRELVSLYQQLKKAGEMRWGFITWYECRLDLVRWTNYQRHTLIRRAMADSITTLNSSIIREMFEEFIATTVEELLGHPSQYYRMIYRLALRYLPNHWYIQQWKQQYLKHHAARQLGQVPYRIIEECRPLLKKQYRLVRALIELGVVERIPLDQVQSDDDNDPIFQILYDILSHNGEQDP